MSERRTALLVACDEFVDKRYKRLAVPIVDARAFAKILGDPEIGQFSVTVLANKSRDVITDKLAEFFEKARPNDVLLLYLAGHGDLDDRGNFYFVARNTKSDRLLGSGIPARFIHETMVRSLSKRQILILDCCYSGAFSKDWISRSDTSVGIKQKLAGEGRIVLTASDALEFAYEKRGASGEIKSLFTSRLIEGMEGGQADLDDDGFISVDELYNYIEERLRCEDPSQTPLKAGFVQGPQLWLGRAVPRKDAIPRSVLDLLRSNFPTVRRAGINELKRLVSVHKEVLYPAVSLELTKLLSYGDPNVQRAAASALRHLDAKRGLRKEGERQQSQRRERENRELRKAERRDRKEKEPLEQERRDSEEKERLRSERERLLRVLTLCQESNAKQCLESERRKHGRLEAWLEEARHEREKKERLDAAKREREEQVRLEAERREAKEKERQKAEQRQRQKKEQLEKERREQEKKNPLEAERRERQKKEQLEKGRREQEKKNQLEAERRERQRKEKLEAERRDREEKERLEKERRQRDLEEQVKSYLNVKDYAKALLLLQDAADAGNASAMFQLGSLYQTGGGTGWLFHTGRGVRRDYAKALEWYQKAAHAGNTNAMFNLGVLYASGRGVAKDYAKAREWYQKGAEAGNRDAMNNLGTVYHLPLIQLHVKGAVRDFAKAREWYQKAADAGSPIGMYNLGRMYHHGWGVAKDYAKAREWYQKAADAGNAAAMYNLGQLYENGWGVVRDRAKAREWYQKAADAGDKDAEQALSRLWF
jgi:TPR repeat protein